MAFLLCVMCPPMAQAQQASSPAPAGASAPGKPLSAAPSGQWVEAPSTSVGSSKLRSRSMAEAVVETGAPQSLLVGDVLTLRMPGVARIAIGNGSPVRATVVDDREIVMLAEAPGRTTVHVWFRSGRQVAFEVEVVAQRVGKLMSELQGLLASTPGVSAKQVGDRVVLEGRYQNKEAAVKVQRLASNFQQILNLVPEQPLDADPLQLERMVHIDLRVVEVKRRALDQLGIRWADTATGPTFVTNALAYANTPWRPPSQVGFPPVNTANPVQSFLGLATQITSALKFLESRGEAWTLAEPRLSCRSGGAATFLSGGEIPIPVAQGNGAIGVEYKQYGVRIDFKPLADGDGNIDSALMVEVSEPDTRNSNAGFVAFATNRTETRVAMKEAEPLIISGLLRQRHEKSSDGVPGLSRLPLISVLFKSRENTTEQTELFVVATPHIITPGSALNKEAVQRAKEIANTTSERTRDDLTPTPLLNPASNALEPEGP